MKIIIQQNTNGAWFWHLAGANGEIVASSEAYSSKGNCTKTAKAVASAGGFDLETVKG
jgi:uncharacterized protein YegP (UPF0339 family)